MKQIRNAMLLVGGIFAAIGLFFLIFGAFEYTVCDRLMTEGVSVQAEAQWYGSEDLRFFFEAEGKRWEVESAFQSDFIRSGDEVTLWYKDGDPMSARITDWWTYGIFVIMGGVFALIGLGFVLWQVRGITRERYMREHGERVEGRVLSVERVQSMRVNGVCPYVIRVACVHPYTGCEMTVKSSYLMYDPSPYLAEGKIDVLMDRMDEKRYYVLVDELLKRSVAISADMEP